MHGRLTALTVMLMTLAVAAPATASADDWPRRLFMVAGTDDPQMNAVQDFLERPDGTILIASGSEDSFRGQVRELGLDGRLRTVVEFPRAGGRSGIGLLADRGSRFLAVDGESDRIVRVRASGKAEPFAGTGRTGFSGDGGPALAARLRFGASGLVGMARTADGSVVFPDAWNNRVRRVRPDGVIETTGGTGPSITPSSGDCPLGADGVPAAQSSICRPTDVLATADGALLVTESGWGRVRRIAPDGTITTIAGDASRRDPVPGDEGKPATEVPLFVPQGLALLPDGDLLISEGGQIRRLGADGHLHPFLRFGDGIVDFTGREVPFPVSGLVPTAEGGLLIASENAYYLAPRHTRRMLIGIRGARVRRGSVALDVQTTRTARATVTVRAGGRTVARTTRRIRGGHRTLTVRHAFSARPHTVRVRLPGASDRVDLYLGTRLDAAYVKKVAEGFEEDGFPERCRRFTARRVDCVLNLDGACAGVASYTLRSTGVIWRRAYGCRDLQHPFRRNPTLTEAARPVGAPHV
jgi:hypothetical protein